MSEPTLKNLSIDLNELKIIQDEMERECFGTQQRLFNEIYDRVIKPQIENQEAFENGLRELYAKLCKDRIGDIGADNKCFLIEKLLDAEPEEILRVG